MSRLSRNLFALASFALIAASTTGLAQDTPAPPVDVPEKQDWSGYATYKKVLGEVVTFEDPVLTIKITWYEQSRSSGGGRGRPQRPKPPTAKSEELDVTFAEQGLVRWYKLAPEVGPDGRKIRPSYKEIQMKKLPRGAPGYIASRADLQPGQIVEVTLVRPRDIPLTKLAATDLQVQYVVIAGENKLAGAEGLGAGFEKKEPEKE